MTAYYSKEMGENAGGGGSLSPSLETVHREYKESKI